MTSLGAPAIPGSSTERIRPRRAMTPPYLKGPGSVSQTVETIQWAEAAGYDDVWLADAGGIDALTLAAVVLQCTNRIRVGIAVVPAYTRTPAVFAATIATLSDIAPGRFVLGLGTSSQAMIEGWHGMTLERPLTRMRETTALLQTMLSGEKTQFAGTTLCSNGYHQPPLAADVPIMLAALGPAMIKLAAEVSAGVILNLCPISALNSTLARIANSAADVGRDPTCIEVGARLQVMVTDDVDSARDRFRFAFAPYFANPVYNKFLASCGFAAEAAELQAARARGDWAAARRALPDDLVDEIAVIGGREHCQERVAYIIAAGVTTPMLFCMSDDGDVQRRTYEAFSAEQFDLAGAYRGRDGR